MNSPSEKPGRPGRRLCDAPDRACAVVKVGGSLFDLPDLGDRLRRWLRKMPVEIIVIPGGGPTANAVRELDRKQRLGEEDSHWLALTALTFNAAFLSLRLPGSQVIDGLTLVGGCWQAGRLPILDPFAFCRHDESRPDHLPHSWAVTSDSVAARVAVVAGAAELILLKSAPRPPGDLESLAAAGYVDPWLPRMGLTIPVQFVDLRSEKGKD